MDCLEEIEWRPTVEVGFGGCNINTSYLYGVYAGKRSVGHGRSGSMRCRMEYIHKLRLKQGT